VQFAPTSIGGKTANVSVSDNASGSPQTVSLSGTGINPKATLNPTTLTFSQSVGTTSATTNIQLSNPGTTTLSITVIALAGTNASQFALVAPTSGSPTCPLGASNLNAGSSCFLGVQFLPTSPGAKSASVSVTDNAPGSPQAVTLSGTGIAPALTLSQTAVSFGDVNVAIASATSNVQLSNSGTATLSITSITLSGTDPSQFALVAPTSGSPACPVGASSLNPGNFCFLGVEFKPTAIGSRSASISVVDNAAGTPHTTALSGVGVDFSIAAALPTTVTVAAGANASFTINLTTTGGSTQNAATFSASGNPAATSVSFSPPSISSGTSASSTAMSVSTTRRSNGWPTSLPFRSPRLLYFNSLLCLAVGNALLFLKWSWMRQKKLIRVWCLGMALCAGAAFQGCAGAGSSNTPSGGTPASTSTITVTATAGSVSRTTTVVLTVQ